MLFYYYSKKMTRRLARHFWLGINITMNHLAVGQIVAIGRVVFHVKHLGR